MITVIAGNLARAYYWSGRRTEAVALYHEAIEACARRVERERTRRRGPHQPRGFYAKLGDRTRALEQLARLPNDIADPHVLVFGAVAYMDLADRGAALTWLERAAAHGMTGSELRDWIELDPLKGEPRFAALIR